MSNCAVFYAFTQHGQHGHNSLGMLSFRIRVYAAKAKAITYLDMHSDLIHVPGLLSHTSRKNTVATVCPDKFAVNHARVIAARMLSAP